MGALTNKERDGLNEIFTSIHTNDDKYPKIKYVASLFFSSNNAIHIQNFISQAKYGLKKTKLSQYLFKESQKKKNLSK